MCTTMWIAAPPQGRYPPDAYGKRTDRRRIPCIGGARRFGFLHWMLPIFSGSSVSRETYLLFMAQGPPAIVVKCSVFCPYSCAMGVPRGTRDAVRGLWK